MHDRCQLETREKQAFRESGLGGTAPALFSMFLKKTYFDESFR
jgi:hypothetical protein